MMQKTNFTKLISLLLILTVLSCSNLDREIKLSKDQSITAKEITIKVTEIIYSPCPKGVQCIWEGISAKLEITKGEEKKTLTATQNTLQEAFNYKIFISEIDEKYVHMKVDYLLD